MFAVDKAAGEGIGVAVVVGGGVGVGMRVVVGVGAVVEVGAAVGMGVTVGVATSTVMADVGVAVWAIAGVASAAGTDVVIDSRPPQAITKVTTTAVIGTEAKAFSRYTLPCLR